VHSLEKGALHVRHTVTLCSSVFPVDSVLSGLVLLPALIEAYRLFYERTGLTVKHSTFCKCLCVLYLSEDEQRLVPYIKKVKCTLVQALRLCTGCTVHRGSRGIALLFLDHGTTR